MRTLLLLALALTSGVASADTSQAAISATGTLYLTFDIGMGNGLEGVLLGRFVPDANSLAKFPAVTGGQYPGPVSYITLRPTIHVLELLVGADEATRLSHDRLRIVQVPVQIQLSHYKAIVECDARAYRATLVSAKPLGSYRVATRDSAPIGC
jgi:hypothetical protein